MNVALVMAFVLGILVILIGTIAVWDWLAYRSPDANDIFDADDEDTLS